MVLCVSCEAGLSSKVRKGEVEWEGTDWVRASSPRFETAQTLHASTPPVQTYQVFNDLSSAAPAGFQSEPQKMWRTFPAD